jgi:MFS family permease
MSPVVDAIPNDHKGTSMSLLHSFFAWGQVATIVITSLFLFLFGLENWQFIVFFWALIPLANFFMFLRAPFPDNAPASHRKTLRELLKNPFFILIIFAIFFGGGTELIMAQFASSFMEKAVLLPKLAGDIVGVAGYAVMMGVGRIIFSRKAHTLSIHTALIATSALGILCYLIVALSPFIWLTVLSCILCGLASSMLWPGVIIIAGDHYPMAGSWIFALLAASGDIGAAFGPWITSVVIENSLTRNIMGFFTDFYHITTEQAAIRIGILFAVIFPVMALVIHLLLKRTKAKEQSVQLLKEVIYD